MEKRGVVDNQSPVLLEQETTKCNKRDSPQPTVAEKDNDFAKRAAARVARNLPTPE